MIATSDATTGVPDPTTIATWPAAVVAVALIVAVLVLPSVLTYLGNQRVKRVETTLQSNNGGSSVRDALDRIEGKLDEHGDRLAAVETHIATTAEPEPAPVLGFFRRVGAR